MCFDLFLVEVQFVIYFHLPIIVQTVKKLPIRARPRPYADPYRGHEPWEGDSVLSSWSVDDKVNRLLYGEEASTVSLFTMDMP